MKTLALRSLILSCVGLSGCYAHTPVAIGDVHPGDAVRVRLTAAEAERLEQDALVVDRVFRAQVVQSAPSGLLVRVPLPGSDRLAGDLYTQLSLTPQQVVELELRELDGLKTAGAVAVGAVVAAAAAFAAFKAISAGDGEGKEPGEPTQSVIRIPFLTWGFR